MGQSPQVLQLLQEIQERQKKLTHKEVWRLPTTPDFFLRWLNYQIYNASAIEAKATEDGECYLELGIGQRPYGIMGVVHHFWTRWDPDTSEMRTTRPDCASLLTFVVEQPMMQECVVIWQLFDNDVMAHFEEWRAYAQFCWPGGEILVIEDAVNLGNEQAAQPKPAGNEAKVATKEKLGTQGGTMGRVKTAR